MSLQEDQDRSDNTKDLWSIALEERDRNAEERRKNLESQGRFEGETNVFFMGSQNAVSMKEHGVHFLASFQTFPHGLGTAAPPHGLGTAAPPTRPGNNKVISV